MAAELSTYGRGGAIATTQLRLLTPSGLRECLRVVGIQWDPLEHAATTSSKDWLYTWVSGRDENPGPLDQRGILYIGIDESEDGRRVASETQWARDPHVGHSTMVWRQHARALGGPVTLIAPDREALRAAAARGVAEGFTVDEAMNDVHRCLRRLQEDHSQGRLLRAAECLAIRASVFAGDTGTPVNSAHKGAFDTKSGSRIADYNELAGWLEFHITHAESASDLR